MIFEQRAASAGAFVRALRGMRVFGLAAVLVAGDALAATYGPVGNETLWTAAKNVNALGRLGSTAQVAWALYESNPQAFDGSPSRLRPGATLTIPERSAVKAINAADAYAKITGAAPVTVAAAAPAPAPATTNAPAAPVSAPPVVQALELKPMSAGQQWVGVVGENFAQGARLEFKKQVTGATAIVRTPVHATAQRLDYQAKFGKNVALWEVTVVNPDGARSMAYSFGAGPGTSIALAPPPPSPPVTVAAAPVASKPAVATGSAAAVFANSPDQQAAIAMLTQGAAPADVYVYLAEREYAYAGDVDYDYALGANAYDSARYDDAVFVLQRAVAAKPKFAGARMELARAYYAVGDNESARREFTTLQGQEPPEDAARAIAEYLDAIDARASAYQRQLSAFVELAGGYDSNANGGPDTQTFLGFTLDPRNRSTSTGYYGTNLGGALSWPLAVNWRAYGDAFAGLRDNSEASFVNSQTGHVGAGLEWAPEPFVVSLSPGYTYSAIENDPNHHTYAVDLSGGWSGEGMSVNLTGRYAQNRFIDSALTLQDVDTTLYGLTAQVPVPGELPAQLGVAFTTGHDEPRLPLSQFGRDLTGVRAFMMNMLGRGNLVMLSGAILKSEYDAPFLGLARNDEQRGIGLSWQYLGFKPSGWGLGAQLNWSHNQSSVGLYEYDRLDAGITLRREFK